MRNLIQYTDLHKLSGVVLFSTKIETTRVMLLYDQVCIGRELPTAVVSV